MKTLAASLAAAVVLVIAATPSSAHRGSFVDCGDQNPAPLGVPYTNLKADNVSCRVAHKIATKYTEGSLPDEYRGWSCKDKQIGHEELKVKCGRVNNGGQRLKFFWGA